MVLYFSATGNTRFVAEELARSLGDTAQDMLERIQKTDYSPIHSELPFVVCCPTIVSEMPRFFYAFLKKTPLTGSRALYFVFTSGGYAGISSWQGKQLARRKGMDCMGCAELTMPNNYIASNAFSNGEPSENEARIRDTAARLPDLAGAVQRGERLTARRVWLLETLFTLPFNPAWYRLMHRTRAFHVTDKCISCGKCARGCPMNVIRLDANQRPVWTKRSCAHCMACIQNCPAEAIEYGDITQKKPRYRFDKYRRAIDRTEPIQK